MKPAAYLMIRSGTCHSPAHRRDVPLFGPTLCPVGAESDPPSLCVEPSYGVVSQPFQVVRAETEVAYKAYGLPGFIHLSISDNNVNVSTISWWPTSPLPKPAAFKMPIQLPTWSQTKTTSKAGFDKAYRVVDKLGGPINRLSHKVGSEAFWPTTLDKEADKAARILRSFCKDGFYVEEQEGSGVTGEVPKGKVRVIKKIPIEVIRNAKGLAIFTTMRTGLWVSGAGGSGVLLARTSTGEWSPPSGIMLHTAGLGFLVGVDIYDCVVVINNEKALEAFSKIRCTIGGEISAVAGPVGIGGVVETEIHKRQAPLWTYLKSRGFYAGVQVDGTIVIERSDENERFYGERIGVADILAGKAKQVPYTTKTLMETIKAAQGDTDVDETALPDAEPPGDMEVEKAERPNGFGLPAEDDPDPFGVHALEKIGLQIREAGSNSRPSVEAFEYKPSPSSPIYSSFKRHSAENIYRRSSKRSSLQSVASVDRGTQTEPFGPNTGEDPTGDSKIVQVPTGESKIIKVPTGSIAAEGTDGNLKEGEINSSTPRASAAEVGEGPTIPVISRARLVNIPKRIPPALPPRNPDRNRPSIITNTDPNVSPVEAEPQGIAADFGDTWSRRRDINDPNTPVFVSPIEDETGDKVASLVVTTQHFPDPDRLSPRKDQFDEISLSGSDYSYETPLPNSHPIVSNINVPNSVETPSTKDRQLPSVSTHEDLSNKTTTDRELEMTPTASTWREHEEIAGKTDEFHSIPSTPLEAMPSLPGSYANQKEEPNKPVL